MATEPNTAAHEEWKSAFNKLTELNQNLIAASGEERDALERAISEQEEDVLDTPAPSFSAVVTKLYLLWDEQLEGLDPETEAKRLILEDLEGLIRQGANLLVTHVQDVPAEPGWIAI